MKEVLGDGETLGQYAAAAKVLKVDAANRVTFFQQTQQEIKDRMAKGGAGMLPTPPAPPAPPPAPPTAAETNDGGHDAGTPAPKTGGMPPTKINPANNKLYYLHSDNNYYLTPAVKK